MSAPVLSLRNISAGYGSKTVVSGISFDVRAGELCALLGLNGSGKTTLLKALCGLLPLKSGNCLVYGNDCTQLSEYKRAQYISYIPQRHSKLQGVRVLDVVMMGFYNSLGALEYPTAENKCAALRVLENMKLADLAYDIFSNLSDGQKQMAVLARTLVQNTPVMLMDEPDSALDFTNRRLMLTMIKQLIRNEGKSGLVTLHEPNVALGYCDRLFLIHGGKIVCELCLSDAGREDVERCLSAIYGNIAILEHGGRYIAVDR